LEETDDIVSINYLIRQFIVEMSDIHQRDSTCGVMFVAKHGFPWLSGCNMPVAVSLWLWSSIALEPGVVMLLYLDHTCTDRTNIP